MSRKPVVYADYIRSPKWWAIRERRVQMDGGVCLLCGGAEELNVHHLTYERLGRERLSDLRTVCQPCHKGLHENWKWEESPKPRKASHRPQPPKKGKKRRRSVCPWCGNQRSRAWHNKFCVPAGVDQGR